MCLKLFNVPPHKFCGEFPIPASVSMEPMAPSAESKITATHFIIQYDK